MIHSNFYKILGWIHVTVVFSILLVVLSFASAGFLLLPLLATGFNLCKEIIESGFDTHLSVGKYVYHNLKKNIILFRFNGIYIAIVLNTIGTMVGILTEQSIIMYCCSVLAVFAFIFLIYTAFYATWIEKNFELVDVFVFMFCKLQYVLLLFVLLISLIYFGQNMILFSMVALNFLCLLLISVLLSNMSSKYREGVLKRREA